MSKTKTSPTVPRQRKPKKPPFTPIKQLKGSKWWCGYEMHSFTWEKLQPPVDCPERHAVRAFLLEEMTLDSDLKSLFKTFLEDNINNLSNEQIVELIKRVKTPQETEI